MSIPPRPCGPDVRAIRDDFPMLRRQAHGRRLVYLDNAATTQTPAVVIDRLVRHYTHERANVHRAVHYLGGEASAAYERARETVRRFLNAAEAREVVFVSGATEAVNLVAETYGRSHVSPGDEILVSQMEHHSNLLPWQRLCAQARASLRVIPITDAGELRLDAYQAMLHDRTRLVAVTHVANALGTVNPVAEIVRLAHARGVPVLVDGAQAVAHRPVDVRALGCDFYVCSAHKVYGPTGTGALYGRADWLERMPPYQSGGGMVRTVTADQADYADPPHRFEAGTPNVAGAVGFAAALEYVESLGFDWVQAHERDVLAYAVERLARVPGLRLVGTPRDRAGLLSCLLDGVHAHDVATVLDRAGVAVRAGHHCCQPLMARLGVPATVRVSCAVYTTQEDVDSLVDALADVRRIFG
jgi:cysteine desulfurase/selenocysteine lyase